MTGEPTRRFSAARRTDASDAQPTPTSTTSSRSAWRQAVELASRDLAERDGGTSQQAYRQQPQQPRQPHRQSSCQSPGAADGRYAASSYSSRSRSKRKRRRSRTLICICCVLVCALAASAILVPRLVTAGDASLEDTRGVFASVGGDAGDAEEEVEPSLPTPIMAECDGIELHSAVAMEELTEILIHNASYDYAMELTTELTEATNTEVMENHGTGRVASEQPTGDEWMTGEFIRCFRSTNAGPTLSAIDCGGAVGTTVYSPVDGTVVLVKEYKLYDEYDDIQIHIQPEGRDDLDVVLIHVQNAVVEAGDEVTAGVTELAEIRDVYAYIGESMQLKDYTAKGDNGNHTHIQVNDATAEDYTGLDDVK